MYFQEVRCGSLELPNTGVRFARCNGQYQCEKEKSQLYLKGVLNMSKFYNGIMGLVVGDALGVPVEFRKRDTYEVKDMIGFGTYNQKPGTWSDDSSLTLATVESMGRMGKVDPMDIMKNFLDWLEDDWFTPCGEIFDVGGTTRRAIIRFSKGTDPLDCGSKSRMDNGNGALMRILPVAMLPDNSDKQAQILNVAHLTHAHFISDFACIIYTAIVENLMKGNLNDVAVLAGIQRYKEQLDNVSMLSEFKRLEQIEWLERNFVKSSGYVVDTLEAALWCFLNTKTYRDCVLTAVNLGEDTDTVAAVAGGLAGIYYGVGGETGIPESWIKQIARKDWIRKICDAVQFWDDSSR